ncbi:serine/threonine-protein phosphatase 7 long form-like protein, partial [Trifolium medium]|nr:serine/threonine-protein phosphatase 7 long form-like protein [Trifolium medium]
RLLPHDITWTPYEDHRDVCPFNNIALYSGWIRCGSTKIRYLPERVLRQFDYVQTIPRDPHATANILMTVDQIDQHWLQYMKRVLTSDMLGSRATLPSDTAPGYMVWYFRISHPYIICIPEGYSVRSPETDAAVQEET